MNSLGIFISAISLLSICHGSSPVCGPGSYLRNGVCVSSMNPACPNGFNMVGTICLNQNFQDCSTSPQDCLTPTTCQTSSRVVCPNVQTCPQNTVLYENNCVTNNIAQCPVNFQSQAGQCIYRPTCTTPCNQTPCGMPVPCGPTIVRPSPPVYIPAPPSPVQPPVYIPAPPSPVQPPVYIPAPPPPVYIPAPAPPVYIPAPAPPIYIPAPAPPSPPISIPNPPPPVIVMPQPQTPQIIVVDNPKSTPSTVNLTNIVNSTNVNNVNTEINNTNINNIVLHSLSSSGMSGSFRSTSNNDTKVEVITERTTEDCCIITEPRRCVKVNETSEAVKCYFTTRHVCGDECFEDVDNQPVDLLPPTSRQLPPPIMPPPIMPPPIMPPPSFMPPPNVQIIATPPMVMVPQIYPPQQRCPWPYGCRGMMNGCGSCNMVGCSC